MKIINGVAIDGVEVDAAGNSIKNTDINKLIFLNCPQDKGHKVFDGEN